jgi:2-polyprenyl-3-methyl-5-hydroxy-6-metoxy-1,4-benzoquinol methylase
MILKSILNCPICNETEFNTYLSCIDYTASHERFTLKKCNQCQFIFTDPRPEDAALANYYLSDKYISHTGGSNTIIDKLYVMARKMTLGWKRRIIERNSHQDNILDIGCGTGEFLREMKSHSWIISGVEPSPTARESAAKNSGIKIHEHLSEVREKTFSAITLWHVFEHLPDPNQTLQTLQRLLKESGTIFIAVPNLRSYDAQYYQSFWAGYDVPRHLWHFNKKHIKMLIEKNGFRLTKIVPMRLDSFYVSLLSESYKHPKRSRFLHLFIAFFVGLRSNLIARNSMEYSSHIYVVNR